MKRMMLFLSMTVSAQAYCFDAGKNLDAVISSEEYRLNNCSPHLETINGSYKTEVLRMADEMVAEDILVAVSGGVGVINAYAEEFIKRGMSHDKTISSTLKLLRDNNLKFNSVRYKDDVVGDHYVSNESISANEKRRDKIRSKMTPEELSALGDYLSCSIVLALERKGKFAGYHEGYAAFARSRMTQSVIGNFSIKVDSAKAKNLVGTGNKFAEPKTWEGSRFFIVDAAFKNLDTESRAPFPGSLYIKYNGKEYEFDSVEPIMLEGYNIWFDRINPLITMKTKIVYRIPNEIEGDVYWKPGRNREEIRLWCGTVKAER